MKNILVVDDEKDVRELLREKLTKSGYGVMAVEDGLEALEICPQFKPDLILIDIALPKIDGFQVCSRLRDNKCTQEIPVIFLSGKDLLPEAIIEHCEKLQARGFISKFSTLKELLEKIKEVIG